MGGYGVGFEMPTSAENACMLVYIVLWIAFLLMQRREDRALSDALGPTYWRIKACRDCVRQAEEAAERNSRRASLTSSTISGHAGPTTQPSQPVLDTEQLSSAIATTNDKGLRHRHQRSADSQSPASVPAAAASEPAAAATAEVSQVYPKSPMAVASGLTRLFSCLSSYLYANMNIAAVEEAKQPPELNG
eukprot:m.69340 g.69340  ORF g.69340 m.69340 type:complete len:190 (-) comp7806_c0_seq2:187-756(-)